MAQTRAVMPARYVPLADELLQTTGINDYSTLIGILLSRYGKHLLSTWEIANCPPSAPINSQQIAQQSIAAEPFAPEPFAPMEF
jgi:hypothetical protein